jgi:hypothetical protein
MKKIVIIGLLSLCAAGAYAQGTLSFGNYLAGTLVTHIYSPDSVTPTVAISGNAANDTPVGTQTYPHSVLIGGSSGAAGLLINYANGNNFTVQIYAAANVLNASLSSLSPVSSYITTLSTTASPGPGLFALGNQSPDPGIPYANTYNDALGGTLDNRATVALACWYNAGGTITSMAAAQAAQVPYGESAAFNIRNLGEPGSILTAYNGAATPPSLPANMTGLTSFSLVGPATVPEPSTIALGVMGVCAFLARRRMK